MNKKLIKKYIIIALICMLFVIAGVVLDASCTVYVYDRDNSQIAKIIMKDDEIIYECADDNLAYVDVVWDEAVAIVMEQNSLTEADAVKYLINKGVSIYTEFDSDTNNAITKALSDNKDRITDDFAVAISDTKGAMLGCCSYSVDDSRNYVITPTYAASAIKPLSVYGPAIDEGIINWSSLVNDSPVTKIETVSGEEDWPRNVEYYTYEDVTVAEALQKSYNTVAVKVLKTYGVEKSCDYVADNFGIDVNTEKQLLEANGEDEILGNIGLGYLREGVTVKDMSGYYQIFANGGNYSKTHSINKICVDTDVYYQFDNAPKQVMSSEAAYVCNRLLKLVTQAGGTAEGLDIGGADLCVKTGTSDDFNDNWIVGVTPEYVCALWYSSIRTNYEMDENFSREVFTQIMMDVNHDLSIQYHIPEGVVVKDICKSTGLCATDNCDEVFQGYYTCNPSIGECGCK